MVSEIEKELNSSLDDNTWVFNLIELNQISQNYPVKLTYTVFSEEIKKELKECKSTILLGLRNIYGLNNLKQEYNTIIFPDGIIKKNFFEDQSKNIGSTYYNININFLKENKKNILKFLTYIATNYKNWDNIMIKSPHRFDVKKIDKLCLNNKWDIYELNIGESSIHTFKPNGYFDMKLKLKITIKKENITITIIKDDIEISDIFSKFDFNKLNDLCKKFLLYKM